MESEDNTCGVCTLPDGVDFDKRMRWQRLSVPTLCGDVSFRSESEVLFTTPNSAFFPQIYWVKLWIKWLYLSTVVIKTMRCVRLIKI